MIERDFSAYEIEILDEIYEAPKRKTDKTVKVKFFNNERVNISEMEYGYINKELIFDEIDAAIASRNLCFDECFIPDFSLSEYRVLKSLELNSIIDLQGFSAAKSFFHSKAEVDFSYSTFGSEEVNFTNTIFDDNKVLFNNISFGDGEVNFDNSLFLNGDVNFSHSTFGEGEVSFTKTIFREGHTTFEKVNFGCGAVNFINAEFKDGLVSFAHTENENGRISFKMARFGVGKIDFSHINWGEGEVTFEKTLFNDGDIIFRTASFGNGKVDFTRAQFGTGKIDFSNAIFGEGSVSFVNTEFHDGKTSFKLTNFNGGKVDFHFASFGVGDLIFERTLFGDGLIDFRTTDFNDGKVTFNRVDFGNGDIIMEACDMKRGKMSFKNSVFGKGELNFEVAVFDNADVEFDSVDFGSTNVSFNRSRFKNLTIHSSHLNNYFNLRVEKCLSLKLVNSIIRDIVDIQPVEFTTSIDRLDMSGMRLLGRIYIDWRQARVKDMIYKQNTSLRNKSEQFRMLKENYNSIGQYVEEDEAYVEFKRTELIANYQETLKRADATHISHLKSFQIHYLIKNTEKIPHEKKAELMFIIKNASLDCINNNEDFYDMLRKNFGYNNDALLAYKEEVFKDFNIEDELKKNTLLFKIISAPPYLMRKAYAWMTYWAQWLIFDKVGLYATDPIRVLTSMVFVYLGFTMVYMILPFLGESYIISSLFEAGDIRELSYIGKAFYHSAITFLTIGYGDYYPDGLSRWMSSFEGFTGLFLMSYFTVAFVRKILR